MKGLNQNTGNTTLRAGMLSVRVNQNSRTTSLKFSYLGNMGSQMTTVDRACVEATGYNVGELVTMASEWEADGGIDYLWTVDAKIPTQLL